MKITTIVFSGPDAQAEKDAAIAEQKEQTLKCDAKHAECLAQLQTANVTS